MGYSNCRSFTDYEKACAFNDKVGGQIQWCRRKGSQNQFHDYWLVWY